MLWPDPFLKCYICVWQTRFAEEPEIPEASTLLEENLTNPEIINVNTKVSSKSRTTLWLIMFSGFVINYMVRCNTNMAIVAMIAPRKSFNSSQIMVFECFNHSSLPPRNDSRSYEQNNEPKKSFSIERSVMDLLRVGRLTIIKHQKL